MPNRLCAENHVFEQQFRCRRSTLLFCFVLGFFFCECSVRGLCSLGDWLLPYVSGATVFCRHSTRSHSLLCATLPMLLLLLLLLLLRQIKAPLSIRTDVSSMKNVDRIASERFRLKSIFCSQFCEHRIRRVSQFFNYLFIHRWFPLLVETDQRFAHFHTVCLLILASN